MPCAELKIASAHGVFYWGLSMQHITVEYQGVSLAVQVSGQRGAPSVLFLHGFPDNQNTWHHQVSQLQAHYQVITFDMRGVSLSGDAAGKDAYQIEHMMGDVEAVINAVVGKEATVHLVGHDWGSVIGWSFVSEPYYARRVRSFTSLSGPHLGLMWQWARRNTQSLEAQKIKRTLEQMYYSWYVLFFNMPRIPECVIKRKGLYIWQSLLTKNGVALGDEYLNGVAQADVERIMLRPLDLYRQNPFSPPSIPQPKSIDVPVQLIIAKQDKFISPHIFTYVDEYVQDLTVRHLDAKHWAHHSHWLMFNDWVDTHIQLVESL